MNQKQKDQIIYEKNIFNNSKIYVLSNIFRCNKCKHNNTIQKKEGVFFQNCLFCGNPNYTKK